MFDRLYLFFELLALIVVIFQYKKMSHTRYAAFLPYLLFINIYELCSYLHLFVVNQTNAYIVNFIISIEFSFFSIFISRLLPDRLRKKLVTIISGIIVFTGIDIAFIQGFWNMATFAIITQYIMLVVLVCMYFYHLMQQQTDEHISLIHIPDFWVNTGLLFFCLLEFCFFCAFSYMVSRKSYYYYQLWVIISNMANFILYSCLAVSFLCFSRKKISYSS